MKDVEILSLRAERKPVEVELHNIPEWLTKKMLAWLRLHGLDYMAEHDVLDGFQSATGWHLDHFGTSENGKVFVNEPYPRPGQAIRNAQVAEMLHCDFTASDNSFWNPGRTCRYEFRPRLVPRTPVLESLGNATSRIPEGDLDALQD